MDNNSTFFETKIENKQLVNIIVYDNNKLVLLENFRFLKNEKCVIM